MKSWALACIHKLCISNTHWFSMLCVISLVFAAFFWVQGSQGVLSQLAKEWVTAASEQLRALPAFLGAIVFA